MPGNSIELPSGVKTQPRAVFLGTLEPQVLQKALPKVFGDAITYSPLLSLPECQINCSGLTKRLVAKAAPVTLRQREH